MGFSENKDDHDVFNVIDDIVDNVKIHIPLSAIILELYDNPEIGAKTVFIGWYKNRIYHSSEGLDMIGALLKFERKEDYILESEKPKPQFLNPNDKIAESETGCLRFPNNEQLNDFYLGYNHGSIHKNYVNKYFKTINGGLRFADE